MALEFKQTRDHDGWDFNIGDIVYDDTTMKYLITDHVTSCDIPKGYFGISLSTFKNVYLRQDKLKLVNPKDKVHRTQPIPDIERYLYEEVEEAITGTKGLVFQVSYEGTGEVSVYYKVPHLSKDSGRYMLDSTLLAELKLSEDFDDPCPTHPRRVSLRDVTCKYEIGDKVKVPKLNIVGIIKRIAVRLTGYVYYTVEHSNMTTVVDEYLLILVSKNNTPVISSHEAIQDTIQEGFDLGHIVSHKLDDILGIMLELIILGNGITKLKSARCQRNPVTNKQWIYSATLPMFTALGLHPHYLTEEK